MLAVVFMAYEQEADVEAKVGQSAYIIVILEYIVGNKAIFIE